MEADRIKPDFGSSIRLSYLSALQEDYAGALKWTDRFIANTASPGQKSGVLQLKAIYNYQFGRVQAALQDLDRARDLAVQEKDDFGLNNIFRAKIWICYDWDQMDSFLKLAQERFDFRAERKIPTEAFNLALLQFYQGLADVRAGRMEQARAKSAAVAKALSAEKESTTAAGIKNAHYFLIAEIDLSQGLFEEASAAFAKIGPTPIAIGSMGTLLMNNIPLINDLPARVLAGQGKKDKAIAEYERLTSSDPAARRQELIHPFSRFRLAKLYEETGQPSKALAQYAKLAAIWAQADQGLPYVEEARARLAKLKGR